MWLRRVAEDPPRQPGQPWHRPLHHFLANGRLALAAAPTAPHVEDPGMPEASENIPSGQALAIVLPEGVVAGQSIAVAVPGSGEQVNMEVPPGYKPGSELQ